MTKQYQPRTKPYQDLTIDERLPHYPDIEAEVAAMTREQFETIWFANPGGHFRRRFLMKAVDGALDDPFDPERTRADYEPDAKIALFVAFSNQLGRTPTKGEWLAELFRIRTETVR